jgi:hypothetical protein
VAIFQVGARGGRRKTLLASLARQGRHDEVKRVLRGAIVEAHGNLTAVAHLVDLRTRNTLYCWIDRYPELWADVNGARARRRGAQRWVAKTLAALEAGRMSVLEQVLQAAAGMSADEIAAEVDASAHAGSVDSMQFAQAVASSAAGVEE